MLLCVHGAYAHIPATHRTCVARHQRLCCESSSMAHPLPLQHLPAPCMYVYGVHKMYREMYMQCVYHHPLFTYPIFTPPYRCRPCVSWLQMAPSPGPHPQPATPPLRSTTMPTTHPPPAHTLAHKYPTAAAALNMGVPGPLPPTSRVVTLPRRWGVRWRDRRAME